MERPLTAGSRFPCDQLLGVVYVDGLGTV